MKKLIALAAVLTLSVALGFGVSSRFAHHEPTKKAPYVMPINAPVLHPDDGFGRPHTLSGGF